MRTSTLRGKRIPAAYSGQNRQHRQNLNFGALSLGERLRRPSGAAGAIGSRADHAVLGDKLVEAGDALRDRGMGKPLVLNLLNNILSYGTKIAILN